VELLIYVAVFAIATGLLIGISTTILRVGSRESALTETTGQLNFVMQTISRLTRESSAIIVNATSTDVSNDNQAGLPYSRLILRVKDSSGGVSDRDPIIIWNDNGIVKMSEGSGGNQKTSDLTNALVVADKLEFTKFTQYPGHDSVAIDIQLTYNSQNPESRITRSLRSAIARVSAATFDSDLTPGSDNNYSIGFGGSRWKNISISNLLNLGQLASDPPEGQNGSLYYNTVNNVFRGYQAGDWSDLGGGGESSCPSGFTSVASGSNQLGCIQNAEQGAGTWWAANNDCFVAYGGKLPSASEWYIAMNNYTLTNETDDYEWVDEFYSTNAGRLIGNGGLTALSNDTLINSNVYRCWVR